MTKKTKQKQILWKKLNLIDEKVRKEIIKAYTLRCRLKLQERFIGWSLIYKIKQDDDKSVTLLLILTSVIERIFT